MERPPRLHRWQRWLGPLPAGALGFGLMLGLAAPLVVNTLRPDTAEALLPHSQVAVLLGPEGQTGLVVSGRRGDAAIEVRPSVPIGLPEGRTLYLWAISGHGVAQPLGAVAAAAPFRMALPAVAQSQLAQAVELGVSVERMGAAPMVPTGAFVYRGPCGRLWAARAAIAAAHGASASLPAAG